MSEYKIIDIVNAAYLRDIFGDELIFTSEKLAVECLARMIDDAKKRNKPHNRSEFEIVCINYGQNLMDQIIGQMVDNLATEIDKELIELMTNTTEIK